MQQIEKLYSEGRKYLYVRKFGLSMLISSLGHGNFTVTCYDNGEQYLSSSGLDRRKVMRLKRIIFKGRL